MANHDRLARQVELHEGFRAFVYDDATGKRIVPGSVVVGHPTVGIGLALDVGGIHLEEARLLLDRRLEERERDLRAALPWFDAIDEVRQAVLVELAFNLGLRGLLEFRKMLAAAQAGNWPLASGQLLASDWAEQVQKARVETLTRQLLTGAW
jgi:lysozyme